MVRKLDDVVVELNTPRGSVFSGPVAHVELRTAESVIAINRPDQTYLSLTQVTEITIRIGTQFTSFILENAAGSFCDGRLTILAEEIQQTARRKKK